MAAVASLVLALALGLVGVALNLAHHQTAVTALQARMESYVYLVLAAAEVDENGSLEVGDDMGDPRLSQPGSGVYVQVHGNRANWTSPSALGLRLPELQHVAAGQARFLEPSEEVPFYSFQYGLAWQLNSGEEVPFTVSVLVPAREISRQTRAFRQGLWRSLGTAGLILLLAQLASIYLAFRPLQKVARDVARVESGQKPALEGRYPRELEPLARNVNRLLQTEKGNQQRYRNALDSLAHSLKTPLAILRTSLESPEPESRAALAAAVEDMHHLVATRLQRAAVSARRTMVQPVDLAAEVERVLASLRKVYSQKMIETMVTISPGLQFFGEQRDLLELLGNLLDNAFKYGQGKVRLVAGVMDSSQARPGLWLRVEDDGPGIAPEQWPALLQRGVRGDERQEGHGLGLALVLELVTAYGGSMEIQQSELGGAMVYVELPATW